MKRRKNNIKKVIKKKINPNEIINKNNREYNPQLISKNVNARDHLRIFGNKEYDSNQYNNKVNYAKEKIDYFDIIIIIPSKDRYEYLINNLNRLLNNKSNYKFKIIVLNDGSLDQKYKEIKNDFTNIIYLENNNNLGKKKYWVTINKLLYEASKYNFEYLIQIDDDFIVTDDFINNVIDKYNNAKKNQNKFICFDLQHRTQFEKKRWNCGETWIDGCGLYEYDLINKINFKIDPISEKRWFNNHNISSGVWQQISRKIYKWGYMVYKPNYKVLNKINCETEMQKL